MQAMDLCKWKVISSILCLNSMGQINLEHFTPYAQGFVFNPLPKLLHPVLVAVFQLPAPQWAFQQANNNRESVAEVIL